MVTTRLPAILSLVFSFLFRLLSQVVEIRPSDKPGSFTVFAMTGPGDMQVTAVAKISCFYRRISDISNGRFRGVVCMYSRGCTRGVGS